VRARASVPGYLDGYTAIAARLDGHLARINEALREASMNDEEARAFFEKTSAIRRRGADTIVADVRARAPLRKGLDPRRRGGHRLGADRSEPVFQARASPRLVARSLPGVAPPRARDDAPASEISHQ